MYIFVVCISCLSHIYVCMCAYLDLTQQHLCVHACVSANTFTGACLICAHNIEFERPFMPKYKHQNNQINSLMYWQPLHLHKTLLIFMARVLKFISYKFITVRCQSPSARFHGHHFSICAYIYIYIIGVYAHLFCFYYTIFT